MDELKASSEITWEDWLDYFAAKNKGVALKNWLTNKENFYDRYFIIEEPELITICDKQTYGFTEYYKTTESFIVEFKHKRNVKLFSIGSLEIRKNIKL